MNNEIWSYWTPANIEKSDYDIYSICDIGINLIIVLVSVNKKNQELHITFTNAHSFKSTIELYTIARMHMAYEKQTRQFFLGRQFYKILHSKYIQAISEESDGASDSDQLEHYTIVTDDSVLDVLCDNEPTIKFIEKQNEQ